MAVDYTPTLGNYTELKPFRYWCQKVLPLVYDDSLSYYELLCKVVDYLNKTMEDVETLHDDVEGLHDAYEQLQTFVNDYFDNLDVQDEINNKLDTMVEDGTFDTLLSPYMQHYQTELNVMKARIDVLEANYDAGGTTADAELADIRVAYNAETYDSAGDAVRATTGKNAYDIININEKADLTNYVDSLGVTAALLQSDGTVSENASYRTTDFIPVNSQTYYVTELTNTLAATYTLYRCTYDSEKTKIAYNVIEAQVTPRDYVPPSNVAYVRFSVSLGSYQSGFKFRKKYNKFDEIADKFGLVNRNLENINTDLNDTDYVIKYGVILGKLTNTGGTDNNNDFRTTEFIPVNSSRYVTGSYEGLASYTVIRATYDANKDLIALGSFTGGATARDYVPDLNVKYVRFSITAAVYASGFYFKLKSNIINNIENIINPDYTVHTYSGATLDLSAPKSFITYKMFDTHVAPSGKTAQGCALWNKKLFQFMNSDLCRVYDIDTGEILSEFSCTCGHGNSAVFSSEYAENNSDYPLIYVSDTNGNVYVLNITTLSATLVRTLYFNPAIFGYFPQLALAAGTNYCYIVGNTTNTDQINTAIITKCDLSNLTNNGASYTPAIVTTFTVDLSANYTILQGVKYLNGCIYLPSGGYST